MKQTTFFLFLVFFGVLSAQNFSVKPSLTNDLEIKSVSFSKLNLKNTLAHIDRINTISIKESQFINLDIAGYIHSSTFGAPALPCKTEIIEIPYGSQIHIKINRKDYQKINLKDWGATLPIAPAQPSMHKSAKTPPAFQYSQEIYQKDKYNDTPLVQIEYLGEMRGIQYARLTISPIQYNPVQNTLKVYHTLDFSIIFENTDESKTLERKQIYYSPEFKGLQNIILNTSSKNSPSKNYSDYIHTETPIVKYLIVADPMFENALKPFVQWKKQEGFTVQVAYTSDVNVGKTSESIKSYLKGLYDNASLIHPAPSYILLVGDIAQIPPFPSKLSPAPDGYYFTDHITDLYYAEYTGDFLPDVHYGRFSASTEAQLLPQIEKTLQMEKLTIPSSQFMDTSILIAGVDSYWGNIVLNPQLEYMLQYFSTQQGIIPIPFRYPDSRGQSDKIIQHINKGACVVSYTAHGDWDRWKDPLLSINEVATLKNLNKYPLMIGNCCLSSKFDKPECFGEALMRADKKGAVVYIGASNFSYFNEDFYWSVGASATSDMQNPTYEKTGLGVWDRVFHTHGEDVSKWVITASDMLMQGNMAVMAGTDRLNQYYWEIYHVLGDPSYRIQVRDRDTLKITHPSTIAYGSTEIQVETEPYTRISILQGDQLLAYSIGDSTGKIKLPITFTTEEDLQINAWTQFKKDYVKNIPIVLPSGAYVLVQGVEVKDAMQNKQTDVLYSNEYVLDVDLKNMGLSASANIKLELFSLDSNAKVLISSENLPSINSSQTLKLKNKLKFKVSPHVDNDKTIYLKLKVSSPDQLAFEYIFYVTSKAPNLEVQNLRIDDSKAHNPNGKLDADETITAYISLKNTSETAFRSTQVQISSPDHYIQTSQDKIVLGEIGAGEIKEFSFQLSANNQAPTYSIYTLNLSVSGMDRVENISCKESISLVVEDFESADFTRMEWDTMASTWLISQNPAFDGIYCAMSARIGKNDSSHLILRSNILKDDTIHFHYRVSCEEAEGEFGDYLQFYINDVIVAAYSGVIPWSKASFPVLKGQNTFRWTYAKDESEDGNQDRAWIDHITFPLGTTRILASDKENLTKNHENHFSAFVTKDGLIDCSFNFIRSQQGSIYLKDMLGRKVAVLEQNKLIEQGTTSMQLKLPNLPKAIYFCVFESEGEQLIQKIIKTLP